MILSLQLLIITGSLNSLCIASSKSNDLYVVPFPLLISNHTDGSLAYPYLSLQQALNHIERNYYHRINLTDTTIIHLYPTYHFVNTIRFTQAHSHIQLTTMNNVDVRFYEKIIAEEYAYHRLTTAIISGGVKVSGWTQVSENIYSSSVPSLTYVNQLFLNNQRIVRTRIPTNYSDYLHYAAPLNDSIQARYGFQYVPGQFNYKSLIDAMVVVYHSWTESHHYIDQIIPSNNTIIFTNPSKYPIGTFLPEGKQRFHIENLCESLIPNSFCFINETKTIYLMTNGSYNPTNVEIITPVNEIVVLLAGDEWSKPIEDVIVNNVAIQHGAWNIDRTEEADGSEAVFLRFAAFIIANASSIVVSNVEISHTGAYGLWINAGTEKIDFMNSLITDTGAGGLWIGRDLAPMPKAANSLKIISNEISYGGNVFPSAVGLVDSTSFDVIITDNIIHHHRYNGISVGSTLGYDHSGTKNVLVQGNYIYNTGQHILCDQGGIYTIGILEGTIIHGNVIKNVFSYSMSMFGIYLDEGTSDIIVSNNIVYNIGWASLYQHYGANNTIINNVFARASLNSPPHPDDPPPIGDIYIQRAENHTSWIFTRNIIYNTVNHSNTTVYRPDNGTITLFDYNVYYNPYNAQLLFGYEQMSFIDWQKTGQDNNSIISNPLFAGDINQCDFFTVQSNSPAAKLGFKNITKPFKWTPGCDTDDNIKDNQFYHW
jgi:hypothetical protein